MNTNPLRQAAALSALLAAGLFGPSALAEKFTIAVIPDTQNYCDTTKPQPSSSQIFIDEADYIASQKTKQNIVFVTHVGDVVQHGDLYQVQWMYAQSAMNIIAGADIPFGMAPGNHDYDNYSHKTNSRPLAGSVYWNYYFGSNSPYFAGKSWYGGAFNGGFNSWQTFSAGGKTFLHICLELEASDTTIAWATGVITNHPGMPTIITTHEFLSYQNDAYGKSVRLDDGYMKGAASYNNAQGVWNKLISPNDQIFLVLCGHNWSSTDSKGISDGENLRIDNNASGHPVYQVLTDYQGNTFDADGAPGVYTGGAGWLRLMTFDTENRTIHFQTYSVELEKYAGVSNGPTFNLPADMSDFTLPVPERVFGPWKFGVMGDTQWTLANDLADNNPDGVSVSIVNQINPQFIDAGVKFVVQVGDLTEDGNDIDETVRAQAAQPLLDAGIGFFPMRGNHETYGTSNSYAIPVFSSSYPQTRGLTNTFGAKNFNSPTNVSAELDGLSYSFDFGASGNNARFVVLDNWVTPSKNIAPGNGYNYGYSFGDQQGWISGQLSANSRSTTHAFVFSHQPLIAENHQDSPFVGYTDANPDMQNAFYASLATNNVKYYISGHDHIHQHSLVASPDGKATVEEIINASDSSKFYTPKATNDAKWYGQKYRETSISQECYTVGYYIYTVDGPRVTVDYYSDDHGGWLSDAKYPVTNTSNGYTNGITPNFRFVKKETFGYSLNGKSFHIPQGQSYATVSDSIAATNSFIGTAAKILGGVNSSTTKDGSSRPLIKQVNTGWAVNVTGLASDILTLWGLQEVAAENTDTYTLSLSYNAALVTSNQLASGSFALAAKDADGLWVNAVTLNNGGAPQFVFGPWKSTYALGTYGVDTNSGTVWAVINYQSDYAAAIVQLAQAASISGPESGSVITEGYPTLSWSSVLGSTSYIVALTGPSGKTTYYTVTGNSLALSFSLTNGNYTWSVTACNDDGVAPTSDTYTFTLQRSTSTAAWSFGIISDTQWVDNPDDGFSPNSIPAGIIKQIDQEFINKGVKLVVSVGDTVDTGSKTNLDTRAVLAQELYNAGIGFYMVRGNHEAGWYGANGSGPEIARIFPQNLNGINNATPADCTTNLIPAADLANLNLPAKTGSPFDIGFNFTSPTNVFNSVAKKGLTYAFDYNNVRFVLVDMFDDSSSTKTSVVPQQQSWITSVLSDVNRPEHAFVFTHKNIVGGQHKDGLFGTTVSTSDPGDCSGVDYSSLSTNNQTLYTFKQKGEEAFIASLATNNVRYCFSGHDHHHSFSLVQSPLSSKKIRQMILASDSNKFYVPQNPVSTNETPIAQQLNTVGYYIVTVDGDNVNVDYYAVDISSVPGFKISSSTENTITNTPVLTGNWNKVASYGYGLNGQEYVVPQGGTYTVVSDTTAKAAAMGGAGYLGTSAKILSGANNSTNTTVASNGKRPLSRNVATGWLPSVTGTYSDIFKLWGLSDLGADKSDTFVISMTYTTTNFNTTALQSGIFYLGARDASGNWTNAVDLNVGGTKNFVVGAWNSTLGLGTYGVNTANHTVWAVVNHAGDFAAIQTAPTVTLNGPDSKGYMNVNWPAALAQGYQLQFNSDLNTTNWVPVNTSGFFRLIKK